MGAGGMWRGAAAVGRGGHGAVGCHRPVALLGESAGAYGGVRAEVKLSILYRGPLASCNYACRYCPFAKHRESREEHEADGRALARFVDWVETRAEDRISVFFTPWGEALI